MTLNFMIILLVNAAGILGDLQSDCGALSGGIWSPTTNSCFQKVTASPWTSGGNRGWVNSFHDCTWRAPSGARGRLAHITTQAAWDLVKGLGGEMWLGGRAVEAQCTVLDECWAWYNEVDTPSSCISFVHSDPIKLADNNQDYLRINNGEYQDTEQNRQVDRLCEYVEGKNCLEFGDCCDCTPWYGSFRHTYCDSVGIVAQSENDKISGINIDSCPTCSFTMYQHMAFVGTTTTSTSCPTCKCMGALNNDASSMRITSSNDVCDMYTELELDGICYIYKTGTRTWAESFAYCRSSGAVLAGYFDSCTASTLLRWVNSKGTKDTFWISLRGYSGSGYHLDLDEGSCNTIAFSGTVTAGSPLEDEDATNNQHHVHLDGKIHYHDIADPFTVLCMKRPCPGANPCNSGGVCFLDNSGTKVCSCPTTTKPPYCDTACSPNPCAHGTCTAGACGSETCTCNAGWTGTLCDTDINECSSNPCVNGVCNNAPGTAEWTCSCTAGWQGATCDADVNECASNPCVQGSCTHGTGTDEWSCNCNGGWTGNTCDSDINECASNPCLNGTCSHGIGTDQWSCSCNAGWESTTCNTDVDECSSDPCPNGVCSHGVGTDEWTCTCSAGWSGTNCNTDVDECASDPCPNGVCSHGIGTNQWNCTCNAGWQGTDCNTDVDECASNPCINGVCSHGVGTNEWSCACDPGWNGTSCDWNIDECESDPCIHGNCTDSINGYNCTCIPGYTGSNCDDDVNECKSSPCQNGGTCNDDVNRYTCDCPEEFSGVLCEIMLELEECAKLSDDEKRKRLAMMAAQSLSSTTILVMLGLIIGIFIILLDISVERIFHLGEEASLFVAHLLILLARVPTIGDAGALCLADGSPAALSDTACRIVAASLHYLFLIHFSFLLLESIHNYTTWTNVVVGKPLVGRLVILLLCLAVPMVPVGITAAAWWETYAHDHTCWVNFNAINAGWAAGPILIMSLSTIVICEATGQGEFEDLIGSNHDKRMTAIVSSKGSILIAISSMSTWFTGSLAVHNVSLALYSITSIMNVVLGVLILFFHTLSNTRARKLLFKILCCCCPKSSNPYTEIPEEPAASQIEKSVQPQAETSLSPGERNHPDQVQKEEDWQNLYQWVTDGRTDNATQGDVQAIVWNVQPVQPAEPAMNVFDL